MIHLRKPAVRRGKRPVSSFDADFAARVAAPGVINSFQFNDAAALGPGGVDYYWYWDQEDWAHDVQSSEYNAAVPVIDNSVYRSGSGSLKFTQLSESGSASAGEWGCNIKRGMNGTFNIGTNESIYVQVTMRWNAALANTTFYQPSGADGTIASVDTGANTITLQTGQGVDFAVGSIVQLKGGTLPGGIATVSTTWGYPVSGYYYVVSLAGDVVQISDTPGGSPVDLSSAGSGWILREMSHQGGLKLFDFGSWGDGSPGDPGGGGTSSKSKCVAHTYNQTRIPYLYRYHGVGSAQVGDYLGGGNIDYQNGLGTQLCDFARIDVGNTAGCFLMTGEEWITYQIGLDLFDRRSGADPNWPNYVDARYRFWATRAGVTSLLIDVDSRGIGGGNEGDLEGPHMIPTSADNIGKVFLFPYQTNKSIDQIHDTAYIWYNELIIATQQIPHPTV